jgi:glutathione synthase/RimK-type ligase-like ATP-grasp enzyme
MKVAMLRRRKLGRTSCREIAKLSKHNIEVIRNDKKSVDETSDLVIRWGCTSLVPPHIKVLNSVKAIGEVNNKVEFRKLVMETGHVPKTFFSCEEWFDNSDKYKEVIFRPAYHAQGRNLLKVNVNEYREDGESVDNFVNYHPEFYISEYIAKVAEYRVFVVSGRVACVARKYPADENAIAWNVAQGGKFENVRWDEWNLRVVRAAIEVFNKTTLDFGGVDVMVDGDGKPYILEINSAPSLTSPYRQEAMAKCFDYIIENGKERIPLIERKAGYKKFIHPAVSANALLVEV